MKLGYRDKEQFFHELVQMARSAVPLYQALEMLARNKSSRTGRCARRVREALESQGDLSAAFAAAGFLPGDSAVIEAGEVTGRLEEVFAELELHYHHLADARQKIIAGSIYPLVVFHLGVFVLAIPQAIIDGSWLRYFWGTFPILLGFYIMLALAVWLWRFLCRQVAASPSSAKPILAVPVLGGLLRDWTAWKFSRILALYVRAGGGVLKGFGIAARACENARLRRASEATVSSVQAGAGLGESVRAQAGWPTVLERAIEVGDQSGRLDEELQRAADIFKERTLGRFDAFAGAAPKIFYVAVVFFMAWRMIAMISSVMQQTWGAALGG